MRKFVFLSVLLIIILLTPSAVFAHHRKQVLGDSTATGDLVFPPVTAGPGFILPDSPLYFLDGVFQSIRIGAAFGEENKAKVRAQIAGERMAELRIMLSRNNTQGISTALSELTKETASSAKNLTEAASNGKDVAEVAKQLNETVKTQRLVLGDLENQSQGALRLQFKAAKAALKESKVEIEDQLPESDLENEIAEALAEDVEEEVDDANEAANDIEEQLSRLNDELQEASEKALKAREEALKKAIEEKNEQLKKEEENNLAKEKKKQDEIITSSKAASEQARKAVKEALEAAKKFEEARSATSSSDSL